MNPKICPVCGRAMELNDEGNGWVCSCGNEQPVYYRREEEY